MTRNVFQDRTTERAIEERAPAVAFRPSPVLAALTTSALALPGLAPTARADTPIEDPAASVSTSYYREDDLPPGDFSSGSRERYEVYTAQFHFESPLPLTERADASVDLLYESMSGASPWFVIPQSGTGKPIQVMSGATIEDERVDFLGTLNYYVDRGKDSFSFGVSSEKDYLAFNFGVGVERHFNDKNTTGNFAIGASFDEITPTDAEDFDRPKDKSKSSVNLLLGLSQILSRSTVGQVTMTYKHADGYLSDPYKQAQIGDLATGSAERDRRPSEKDQLTWMLRLRQRIEPLDASLHVDYQFYWDDWDLLAHTFEVAWYQELFEVVSIVPSFRYYSQGETYFYEPFYLNQRADGLRSSDFRLSPYGALSARLKLELLLEDLFRDADLLVSGSYERYLSDGDFALESVDDPAPGLVDFQLFAFSLQVRF